LKNLFEPSVANELKERALRLTPDSERLWGKMNAAQVMAHCAGGLELAAGQMRPPRKLIGRIIGPIVKPLVLRDDEPMRRNTPTIDALRVSDERNLDAERTRLLDMIDRFVATGPAGCTTHPHSFFGPLTPQEWAILMYKHLDHHLRQFGV
jgi:hypothetical protein